MNKLNFSTGLLFIVPLMISQFCHADAYGSGWYGELQSSFEKQDNIGRAYKEQDEVSDFMTSISAGGGYLQKTGSHHQLVFSGYLTYNDYEQYDALDHLAFSLGGSWIFQPTTDYDAIWYGASSNLTLLKYRDSEARDGVFLDIDLNINRRLSTAVVGHVGVRHIDKLGVGKSSAEQGWHAAFNTRSQQIYLGIDYEINGSVFMFAEYAFSHADLTSTVLGAYDADGDYAARTLDPVFDDCGGNPGCGTWWAYRIAGDTHSIDAGLSFPFRSINLDLSIRYFDADSDGIVYSDWILKLGLVWNFS